MSVIRFLHTDSLRLGSPVAGLSESPDWLRKVASSAVRTAVTNVIEAAVAGRCQFLVIAGRLTESQQDLEVAIAWLMVQSHVLRDLGIRLIIAEHPEVDHPVLDRLDAMILGPGERLDVWHGPADRVEYSVSPRDTAARPGALGLEVAMGNAGRPLADLAYVAVPSVSPSSATNSYDAVATAHDQHLRLSAGSPQAINPSEHGNFGCQLVEADLSRRSITARFCSTDVIRFAQELVPCRPGLQASQLCDLLRERSRALGTSGRCTTVVEWIIDGHFTMSHSGEESLCEMELLRELRSTLHAGHSGAWPCRIRFSDNSSVDVAGHRSIVAREFSTVVCDRLNRTERWPLRANRAVIGLPLGTGSEAAVGLDVLRRVA